MAIALVVDHSRVTNVYVEMTKVAVCSSDNVLSNGGSACVCVGQGEVALEEEVEADME